MRKSFILGCLDMRLTDSHWFFRPDDPNDAAAVFAPDPPIPAAEVAVDVLEGSHLFSHYVGSGIAQTLHGHFMRDVVARVPAGRHVFFQSENGLIGTGPNSRASAQQLGTSLSFFIRVGDGNIRAQRVKRLGASRAMDRSFTTGQLRSRPAKIAPNAHWSADRCTILDEGAFEIDLDQRNGGALSQAWSGNSRVPPAGPKTKRSWETRHEG